MGALWRIAVCAGLAASGAAAQTETLGERLAALAPDFGFGWQGSVADIRTRADATQMAQAFGIFDGYDDDGYFDTDTLEYLIAHNEPLDNQLEIAGFSITPDHYVVSGMQDGSVTNDPLIDHYVACGFSTTFYFAPEDVDQTRAAILASEVGSEITDDQLEAAVPDVMWSVSMGHPTYFELGSVPLPEPRLGLLRSCRYNITLYSQSQDIAALAGQQWVDQIVAVAGALEALDDTGGRAVVYDTFGDRDASDPAALYRVDFEAARGLRGEVAGPDMGDMFLQSLRFERRFEASYSDVYAAWTNGLYLSMTLLVPITAEDMDAMRAMTYFPAD